VNKINLILDSPKNLCSLSILWIVTPAKDQPTETPKLIQCKKKLNFLFRTNKK
jgi:hypothetical protein